MKIKILLLFFLLNTGCTDKQKEAERGNPVSGTFTLHSDESYYPLVKILADGFMATYPAVIVIIDTTTYDDVLNRFANGQFRTLFTCKELSSMDSVVFSERNCFPIIFHFASDALALIINVESDSQIFSNANNVLNINNRTSVLNLITDRSASENNYFLNSVFPFKNQNYNNYFPVGGQSQIITRVFKNRNEIGIVSWCYLSDKDDPETAAARKSIRVLGFKKNDADSILIYPSQSSIKTASYPLTRKLFLITAEPYSGPATGFASYVASDEGQRIIRLFGLAPSNTPPRNIEIYK